MPPPRGADDGATPVTDILNKPYKIIKIKPKQRDNSVIEHHNIFNFLDFCKAGGHDI